MSFRIQGLQNLLTSRPPDNKTLKTRHTTKRNARVALIVVVFFILIVLSLIFYTWQRVNTTPPNPISASEAALARFAFYKTDGALDHPFQSAPELSAFNWNDTVGPSSFAGTSLATHISQNLNAHSAIVVDATTGSVLFEKNADEPIPPASMTKLVAMYTAFHAAENGEITFDDYVPLPPQSWAKNIPPGSSLMFLDEGQKVTVRELLCGMAVVSGNDAAIALALYISGSVEKYIERMNQEMENLGLVHTRFVEPTGLSGENSTTAREFADFALVYIREYPQALGAFHSRKTLEYPMQWNLAPESNNKAVVQKATNKLLGMLDGCDGLKTGFIFESGYNLSLTVERNGTRFISVTMGGTGANSIEGNQKRSQDGSSLMEWSFGNFQTVRPQEIRPLSIPVWGGKQKTITAIPASSSAFTAPKQFSFSDANGNKIKEHIYIPSGVSAPVNAGDTIGKVTYVVNGKEVHSVPLIADRSSPTGSLACRLIDSAAKLIAPLVN